MSIFDFSVQEFDYEKRDGNLINEAKSNPPSKKDFPFFYRDDKKIIFKPLSKTKPLTTPFFSYSEVVWSTLMNKFFDSSIPIYYLAKCMGIEEYMPSKINIGTSVECVTLESEYVMSIYEYFLKHPEAIVLDRIKKYTNYCLDFYDYTFFFETELVKHNPEIGKFIAESILYSMLRADQNFHYENISFITENDNIKRFCQTLDHEFSTMFLFLDDQSNHIDYLQNYERSIISEYNGNTLSEIIYQELPPELKYKLASKNYLNIKKITELYPDLVESFINKLNAMIEYLKGNPIYLEDNGYAIPFNSDYWKIGHARYKDKDEEEAKKLESEIELTFITPESVSGNINQEIINHSGVLKKSLENRLSML